MKGALVAFSGGADSALLLRLASDALGERCVAFTAVSPSLPATELAEAEAFARELGVRHERLATDELEREGFVENGPRRCYFCKSELFERGFSLAAELGLEAVLYGATVDDLGDHRPGMSSARERGARAPLLEAGLSKQEIRELSRELGLSTWDKPAMACLSSRFPYGTRITREGLGKVERAENILRSEGFRVFRVRYHDDVARIELAAEEWGRMTDADLRSRVAAGIREAGFTYVSLDVEGFRSGRLNETLQ